MTGAGVEVTEAGTAFPSLEHPRTLQKAIRFPLDQTQFDRQQNAPELEQSTKPFTSSVVPGKATRRPATINSSPCSPVVQINRLQSNNRLIDPALYNSTMKLQFSTWPEIEGYLEKTRGIVIPIGSTEQHGPTGLIGTDALCPEIIAEGLHAEGILIGPTLSIGMAQHHLGFPGSITLRPSTLMAVVVDVVRSLAVQGFEHFYFLNGHGGNIATVNASFAEVYADSSLSGNAGELNLKLANWFAGKRVTRLSRELYGDAEGSHATPSEISLTWHAYPDQQRDVPLEPKRAPDGPIRDAADYRKRFPDGRIGAESGLASREHGRQFYEAALADALEDYHNFLS